MARILVTRPALQNSQLLEALVEAGHSAIAMPMLRIIEFSVSGQPQECLAIKNQVAKLDEYQHVIFVSTNAAKLGADWIDQYWPQLPMGQRYYAIGKATRAVLAAEDFPVEQSSALMNSEGLLDHEQLQQLEQQRVLIFRGVGGREHLRQTLSSRGARVDYCEVYCRDKISYKNQELRQYLEKQLDILTITSAETIQQLLDHAIIDDIKNEITEIPLVAPGNRLSQLAKELGFKRVVEADNAGLDAMLSAVNSCLCEND